MTAAPPFTFAFTYDRESVGAAARTLFLMQQRRTLWLSLGSLIFCFLTVGGIAWYFRFFWILWFPLGLLVLDVLLRLYTRWALGRRLDRTMTGKSAQIQLSDVAFSIASEDGSHVLPWRNFKSTRRDPEEPVVILPATGGYCDSGEGGSRRRA